MESGKCSQELESLIFNSHFITFIIGEVVKVSVGVSLCWSVAYALTFTSSPMIKV